MYVRMYHWNKTMYVCGMGLTHHDGVTYIYLHHKLCAGSAGDVSLVCGCGEHT